MDILIPILLCTLFSGFGIASLYKTPNDMPCPKQCSCISKNTVMCKNKSLAYIPHMPKRTQILKFVGNKLDIIVKSTFRNISEISLIELYLDKNQIQFISNDSFEVFPTLQVLSLNGNSISVSVLHNAFYGLRSSMLYRIGLNNMDLTMLHVDTLEYLPQKHLKELDLQSNNLKIMNFSIFRSFTSLENILLDHNLIQDVVLIRLQSLKSISLRNNHLNSLPQWCPTSQECLFPNLYSINLASNFISTLSRDMFVSHCLPKLGALILDNNELHMLEDNAFTDLQLLKKVSVAFDQGKSFHFETYAFNSSSLEYLDISNPIYKFYDSVNYNDVFLNCPNLKVLNMKFIELKDYTGSTKLKAMLSPLKSLIKLDLSSAVIDNLPVGLFNTMPNLTTLILEHNNLISWEDSTFSGMHSLKQLFLNNNVIAKIHQSLFPPNVLQTVKHLKLQYNPLNCNCDIYWFRQWIKSNHRKLVLFPKGYICVAPSNMKNKLLISYDPSYRRCNPINIYIVLGVVIGSVFITISMVVVITYRYRWHIKHYIYLLRARKGYQRIPEGDDYAYDVFVAYTSNDRVWVISHLIPELENKEKFRLCLHDRDFEPGKLIVDNIHDTIQRSRKTLLVLSNNFAKSKWCNFEMTLAHARHIEEDRNQVIIVMLEDIKAKYISSSLHVLLKSTTYIPWTLDVEGNNLFWMKLVTAIRN